MYITVKRKHKLQETQVILQARQRKKEVITVRMKLNEKQTIKNNKNITTTADWFKGFWNPIF